MEKNKGETPIDALIRLLLSGVTITHYDLVKAKIKEETCIKAAYKQGETDMQDDMLQQVRTYDHADQYYDIVYK
jgi:hypothetical protein